MDNEIKSGDQVVINYYGNEVIGVAGNYDEEKELLWVDLKLMDSMPGHVVFTGFKLSECRKVTGAEAFKNKLAAKGVGAYGDH